MNAKKPTRNQMKVIAKLGLDPTMYLVYHWPADNSPVILINRHNKEKIKRLLPQYWRMF